ncbi:hypothetical protein GCM10009682_60190 [Luedemannella flava]|uniref:HTH deoR-type domain-containing protein n=1 Tax=Luedemannella flava TaxID=349316 RepID=A0ABN2MNZ9_9ACTN
MAVLLLMQNRGRVTAADLARELEVSVATARRDLEALSAAGVPVYPQPGRGGGWSLVGGARTDLSGLSATEARALFLLLGPATTDSGAARSALRKLVRALPQTFRADAEAAAGATMVDPTRWGDRERDRPALVDRLQDAVVARRRVRLTYGGRTGERTERLVDPWGLVDKDEVWYLVAGTDRGQRTFRVDRIVAAEATDGRFDRPNEFALDEAWRRVVGEVEAKRSTTSATVLIDTRFAPILRDHFGRHCHPDGRTDDGRARLRVSAPTALDIARTLAGWGFLVEVVDPDAVRAELAHIGAELTARHAVNMSVEVRKLRAVAAPEEENLMATFSQSDDLRNAEFRDVNLRGARFVECDLSGVVMRGVDIAGSDIDAPWLSEDGSVLRVNGVDVAPFVDTELNRRFPGRAERRAADPDGLRSAWAALERTWAATLDRAAAMPAGTVDVTVDGEWSFAQTLRHLVLATDMWLGRAIMELEQPFHPLGLMHTGNDAFDMSVFTTHTPTYAEVLEARADRVSMVRDVLARITPEDLAAARRNPHNPEHPQTVRSCLHVILEEEWEHHRFAVRDLDAIEVGPGA